MSRQFSLATVARMVTNDLLAQFFAQLKNPCFGMNWKDRPRRHVASIEQLLRWFEPRQREAAELILRHVFDLACASGWNAIRDAARSLHRLELLEQVPDANLYCRGMWVWLNAPEVFEAALLYHEIDGLSWWSKRDGLPQVDARTDADALQQLADDVSRLLRLQQGRGGRCTVEHIHRDDGIDYYFCFPDDHLKTVLVHNRRGRLVTKPLRQTFEIVFAYSREDGALELSARLGKQLRQQLEEAFAWTILDESLCHPDHRQLYDLNRLKETEFVLDTDPSDQVYARIRRVALDLPGNDDTIILHSKRGTADGMRQMVEKYLNKEHVSLNEVEITQAQFQMRFARTPQRGRATMTFDVAHPDRCNLRRFQPDWVAIGQKHLRLWRVAQ